MSANIEQLKKELEQGVVNFTYTKINGVERQAIGTLNPRLIEAAEKAAGHEPKRKTEDSIKRRQRNEKIFVYYNLDKQSWRAFTVANLVSFEIVSKK